MNKPLTLLALCAGIGVPALAAPLSPVEALKRVGEFDKSIGVRLGTEKAVLNFADMADDGEPLYYVFNIGSGNGYMILSGDDKCAPVLGYSERGSFDSSSMPDAMKWWLQQYGRQIEYMRGNNVQTMTSTRAEERQAVSPLLKTSWNQNSPYDLYTPSYQGQKCPTGCVATAMAQVMKYWNYPAQAKGSGSVNLPGTGQKEVMVLGEQPFAWDDMLNSYSGKYTDTQADAVAYLMKACGYAVDMTYAPGGSGAITMRAGWALANNFGYNKNLQYLERDYFTASDWDEIIYNELAAGRPIMYGGRSNSVGHEFVCDGYQGEGYYHFNWGWGGMSDGYFLLDALNPDAVGTGGGTGGGFDFDQDVIVGVQPEATAPINATLAQSDNLVAKYSAGKVNITLDNQGAWLNPGLWDLELTLGVAITPAAGGDATYVAIKKQEVAAPKLSKDSQGTSISYSYIGGNVSFELPDLADGQYCMTVCTLNAAAEDQGWIPVNTTQESYNYVDFTKKGNNVEFANLSTPEILMNADGTGLVSKLYYGCAVQLKISVTNNSEREVTRGFYPLLYLDDAEQMIGEGITLTLQPGESKSTEFQTVFELLNGVSAPSSKRMFTMVFYDPQTNEIYDWEANVTMYVGNVSTTLNVDSFTMPGLESETMVLDDNSEIEVYKVYDNEVIDFAATVTNPKGFFGYPLLIYVFPLDGGNSVASTPMSPTPVLNSGESVDLHAVLNFNTATEGDYYKASIIMSAPKGLEWIDENLFVYFRVMDAGVDGVEVDESGEVIVTDLTGKRVGVFADSKSVDLTSLPKGIYLLTSNGKTVKVIR